MNQRTQPVQQAPATRRHIWFPTVVLVVSLALTLFSSYYAHRTVRLQNRNRFATAAFENQADLRARMESYIALLQGGVALMSAEPDIVRDEFATYVNYLGIGENYPGIQGFGFSYKIAGGQTEALVERMRAQGVQGFRVWPEGPREEFHSIIFLQPQDEKNLNAIGYDMFSEPTRRAAMQRARDTGSPALSGKVTLVQEKTAERKQAGFLIYLPVYSATTVPPTVELRREKLMGFVYAPFRADDLFNSIFGQDTVGASLNREIYDGESVEEGALLHRSVENPARPFPGTQPMELVIPLEIAGQQWTLRFWTGAGFDQGRYVLPLVLVGGLALSFTLFYLTLAQARARREAEETAARLQVSETSLMEARKQLEQHAASLEQRVHERTAQLEQSLADLERVLYHVAHDLRAPARAMGSFAVLLLEEYGNGLDDRGKDYLARISSGALRMDRLVSDLLAYGRTAHMPLPLQPVSLEQTVDSALRIAAKKIEATGATVIVDRPLPKVSANPATLTDVVWQLLSNALKYVAKGTTPKIRIRAVSGEKVRLYVEDNGIGIKPEYQERIFRVFERLHANSEYSGTGIGLAIALKALERMGGRIGVESSEGQGSRFWIELPKA